MQLKHCNGEMQQVLMIHIPTRRRLDAAGNAVGGFIAQQALGFAGVCQAVAHIARAEVAVFRLGAGRHAKGHQVVAHQGKKLFEGGAVAHGHVVDLISGLVAGGSSQQVSLNSVLNEREVAAGFAVAVDEDRLAFEQ